MKGLLDLDVDRRILQCPGGETAGEPAAPGTRTAGLGRHQIGARRRCALVGPCRDGTLALGGFVEGLDEPCVGEDARPRLHLGDAVLVELGDGLLEQIAKDRLDVTADVPDFSELGRLDLDERRLRQPRHPSRDLGLADARRSDHQDVLGQHLVAHVLGQHAPAHPVAQGDRDRSFCFVLTDDVLVETSHHLGRAQRLPRNRFDQIVGRDAVMRLGAGIDGRDAGHAGTGAAGAGVASSRVSTVMLSLV